MFEIGKINKLKVARITPPGAYLSSNVNDDVVLLPNRYMDEKTQVGEYIDVFIYFDSEDRIIATTQKPKILLHEIAVLQVKDIHEIGAFLDWGLEKDLFVPFKEQYVKMKKGEVYPVALYIDPISNRLVASSKLNRFLIQDPIPFREGDEVQLIINESTSLGLQAIIEGKYKGLLYHSELFKKVKRGDILTGFIKKIREDGNIDLTLERQGFENIEPAANEILNKLKSNKGFLPLNDFSSPETIKHTLQMSKKSFKKGIGFLYKQRIITISAEGIQLVK